MSQLSIGARIGRAAVVVLAAGALVIQGGAAWGVTWVVDNERLLKDQLVAHQFQPDDAIVSYAQQAGLSATGELYLMTSLPRVVPAIEFDRYCTRNEPGIGVLGCYTTRDGRIYLYDVTDSRLMAIEPVVAAHEMLHAAWSRLSVAQQQRLGVLLEEAFSSLPGDHQLRERIRSYEDNNPASRIPELYAIVGTEIRLVPRELEEHYAIYFDARNKVVDLADEVYRIFDRVEQELTSLAAELESRAAEIEGLRATYQQTSATLQADIIRFNERASTPGAFPSRSEFEATRGALQDRQNRLESMRLTLQTKIDEYNTKLEELNRLNAEVSELNQGINVRLREEEELSPPSENPSEATFGIRGAGGCCGMELPSIHDLFDHNGLAARPLEYFRLPEGHHECNFWSTPLDSH